MMQEYLTQYSARGYQAYQMLAALAAMLMVLVLPEGRSRRSERLGNLHPVAAPSPARVGVPAVLAAVCARLRSGGTLAQAFEPFMDYRQGAPPPRRARMQSMLLARSLSGKETPRQVERAAVELHVACRLSESLGCEAVRCMEAVARTYRRGAAMQDMKHGAAAMPQATAQLLCALPACTVLLGELFGAGPLGFLFGSPQGLMCLVSGGGAYACGLLWMRGLLCGVDQERFSMAMPGGER